VLRLIRQHPILGLVAALSLEAWLAIPGEAMIALAASTVVGEALGFFKMAFGGVLGMLANDLLLFGLSRVGRGVLVQWIGLHSLHHWHLTARMVAGAKFLPPLRSAAYIIYGLQGTPFSRFLWVSLLSSLIWVGLYALLGRRCRGWIGLWFDRAERRSGPWMTVGEVVLTVGVIAVVWL